MIILDTIVESIIDADFDLDFKGIFTLLKAAFTIRGIYNAILTYSPDNSNAGSNNDDNTNTTRSKCNKNNNNRSTSPLAKPAIRLLKFNALLVVLITFYKLTRREIAPLFLLQLLGHYSCFLTFAALAGFGSHPSIRKRKRRGDRRLGIAIWVFHFSYAVVLAVGFTGAECGDGRAYPVSFLLSDGLFLACYGMSAYVEKRGFDIRDLKKNDDDRDSISSNEEDDGAREDVELYRAQISAFFAQQRLLVLWHGAELLLGYVLFDHRFFEEAITCDANDDAWVFHSKAGKAFFALHTFGVKQSLGVASKVFVKTVRKVEKRQQQQQQKQQQRRRKDKGKKKKDE
mmetsp:Transcript_20204/g.38082  ORF Transcript_20204/g.38082 Transcript_20204/m.38082 type:complete len:343 (-) Transcript_20204:495-1523(-)|eukprot:CAMPEP_0201662414 /NCGR_PEP_ID=MMETSP0494-20130426/4504_1 /ASSEMBLY_ACC=CAM_ASM_000839 /TAXON_ID=420259 /ORGANISM="Thalassiosira gravida, Strain GMp14c1" /LENGTH=342 /DNA_ID=CAMNT_0048140769 /DNA_START=47 /DNA_END=1075 /DNA_ORIENTATION=+